MGQGGYITLINATPYEWKLTHHHSYQMNDWNFPVSIASGKSSRIYVEWCEGIFKHIYDDGGEANYTLGDTGLNFQVQARTGTSQPNQYGFDLRVDLLNMAARTTPAPVPPQSSIVDLGWNHDGNVNFTLLGAQNSLSEGAEVKLSTPGRFLTKEEQNKLMSHVKENNLLVGQSHDNYHTELQNTSNKLFKDENLLVPSHNAINNSSLKDSNANYWLRRWMWQYQPSLKNLTIEEMALPGTHDSGTYDMKSVVSRPWTQTQNLNLEEQLQAGARVLDLRIGIQPDEQGDNKFILVHDTWRTEVTLSNALDQVISFSNAESTEIVLLDFHRFVELETASPSDYTEMINIVKSKLSGMLIPPSQSNTKLDDIWKQKERIIVAWNRDGKDSSFWDGVDQGWFNKSSESELYTAIGDELKKSHSGLWSICAILTASAFDPIHSLSPELSQWFSPAGEWSKEVNIVSCDFINKTQLAQSLITANVIKAYSK